MNPFGNKWNGDFKSTRNLLFKFKSLESFSDFSQTRDSNKFCSYVRIV